MSNKPLNFAIICILLVCTPAIPQTMAGTKTASQPVARPGPNMVHRAPFIVAHKTFRMLCIQSLRG